MGLATRVFTCALSGGGSLCRRLYRTRSLSQPRQSIWSECGLPKMRRFSPRVLAYRLDCRAALLFDSCQSRRLPSTS